MLIDLQNFPCCFARWLILKGGLAEGRRIPKGSAQPECLWTDREAKPFNSLGGLFVSGASEWHGVEHHESRWPPSQSNQLLRIGDRLKVVNLRAAGNDHEVCGFGGGKDRLLRSWRCVYDGNIDTCLFRLLQGALKTGGLGIDDNRRISFAAITPVARGRLRIEINDDRGGSGPFGGNGKREGKVVLPAPPFWAINAIVFMWRSILVYKLTLRIFNLATCRVFRR